MSRSNALRVIAVIGLISAAVFIALPWVSCMSLAPVRFYTYPADDFFLLRGCTFGFPSNLFATPEGASRFRGYSGPYWGNLIASAACVVAAVYVGVSKRF